MTPTPHQNITWRKSSFSGGTNGQCVLVGTVDDDPTTHIYLGDSKNPDGPVLSFAPTAWYRFLTAVKTGRMRARG